MGIGAEASRKDDEAPTFLYFPVTKSFLCRAVRGDHQPSVEVTVCW